MASVLVALTYHYLNYIFQPAVFTTALIIFGGIFLLWFENYKLGTLNPKPQKIPGCYRLGLYGRSYLDANPARQPKRNSSIGGGVSVTGDAIVKALFTYPIKSCRGVELKASEVLATGLKYDRLFTFAQRRRRPRSEVTGKEGSEDEAYEWRFITQREFPKLAAVETELWVPDPRRQRQPGGRQSPSKKGNGTSQGSGLETNTDAVNDWAANGGCLTVRFPSESDPNILGLRTKKTELFQLPLMPNSRRAAAKNYSTSTVKIWKDTAQALDLSPELSPTTLIKLQRFIGSKHPLGLFRVDDSNLRTVTRSLPPPNNSNPIVGQGDGKVHITFTDAFPVNLLNIASVRAVDDTLPPNTPEKGKLDPRRFRANIYISGPTAYAEEKWKRLNIGRCILPRSRAKRDRSPSPEISSRMTNKDGDGDAARVFVETDGEFYVACRTARCRLVDVDPESGERDDNFYDGDEGNEGMRRTNQGVVEGTLRKHRGNVDEGASPHPVLGMQMIPCFPQGVIRVGDEVEVLERGEHVYEKMFK